jgi:hypothetical protein
MMNVISVVSQITLWISVLVLFTLVFLLFRHLGEQSRERDDPRPTEFSGPKLDSRLDLTLKTIDGTNYHVGSDGEQSCAILFTSIDCSSCDRLKGVIGRLSKEYNAIDIVLVFVGDADSARFYAEGISCVAVVSDPERSLANLWGIRATPYAVIANREGIVKLNAPFGTESALASLLQTATFVSNELTQI